MKKILKHMGFLWLANSGCLLLPAILLLVASSSAVAQMSFNNPGGLTYNADGTLTLRWTGPGTLQFAPGTAGPWTTVSSGASYSGVATQTVSGALGFFRLYNGSAASTVLPAPTIPPVPPVNSATIQRLAASTPAGDTLLKVNFQSQPSGLSSNYFFTVNDQVFLLRDDGVYPDTTAGDGSYAAIIPLDTNELTAWNAHVDDVASQTTLQQPVFTGRMITGTNTLAKFDITAFLALRPIPLLPLPCTLAASDFYNWHKTLLITDMSVVADPTRTWDPCGGVGTPMGAWTFGRLMTDMCNQPVTGINPSDFVKNWLRNWQFDQNVNFDTVPNRSNSISFFINQWAAADGSLDLSKAPFRLLAIVNRIDLRSHTFPYDNAGECRFVFGLVDPSNPCNPSPPPFTVILEYGVPLGGCTGIKGWANQWAALNTMSFGPAFNATLQAITDHVTLPGADPTKPNLSAINQVRSNDLLIGNWDLREFVIGTGGYLVEHTVKNTPAGQFNDTPMVTSYCTDPLNIPNILADNVNGPLLYMSVPFLGAHALNPPGTFWNGFPSGSIAGPVRIHFSLNTCNGCHGAETGTIFTHVQTRPPGSPSGLSGFLTGITIPDPAGTPLTSTYADMARRVADLDMVVHKPCLCLSLQRPITTPH